MDVEDVAELSAERTLQFGHYDRLLAELRMEDRQLFFNFLRMPPFDELLNRVGPRIRKMDTNYNKSLDPGGMKLLITIRHLASGDKIPNPAVCLQSCPKHNLYADI